MLNKYTLLSRHPTVLSLRRWKSLTSAKKSKSKVEAKDKALEHFDDFYKPLFSKSWPSIRLGLLTEQKYIAALNNYSDIGPIQSTLENLGAINVRRLFEVQSSKLLEKRSFRKKNVKQPKKLDSMVAELGEQQKSLEETELYSTGPPPSSLGSSSDRYIDPMVSTSQLNEFMPATELKGSDDYIQESTHFAYYPADSDLSVTVLKESYLNFPENLHIYSFDPGNVTVFPRTTRGKTGVSDYILLDGGSLMPVLALDLQPGDSVLDMCAAPGGKSFLAIQTLCPRKVVCNDVSLSRSNRIRRMMNEFFYDFQAKESRGEISITQDDARALTGPGLYNKILVDVPCTTDRHAVNESDNNIFKAARLKERIRLPELQSNILTSALKLVSVGGTVVYSTCSLSPIQNDGVVHMALQKVAEETNSEIAVVDMTEALEPTKILFKYGNIGLRYGHLIVPYIVNNFGPMYFCKLLKLK